MHIGKCEGNVVRVSGAPLQIDLATYMVKFGLCHSPDQITDTYEQESFDFRHYHFVFYETGIFMQDLV